MNSNSKMDTSRLIGGSSCQWLFVATLIDTLKIVYSVKFSKGPINYILWMHLAVNGGY